MSDVEKYGLAAVVFVGGLLVIIAVTKGFGDEDPALSTQALEGGQALVQPRTSGSGPVVIPPRQQAPTPRRQQGGGSFRGPGSGHQGTPSQDTAGTGRANGANVFRVSDIPGVSADFQMTEEPPGYPGEHAASKPAAASDSGAAQAEPASSRRLEYVVQAGDTLGGIAEKLLGSTRFWRDIVTLNPGVDELNLKIGQTLVIRGGAAPRVAARETERGATVTAAPPRGPGDDTYVVQPGDNLGSIAQKLLGSVRDTERLFEANRDVLDSKDSLQVGQVLKIP